MKVLNARSALLSDYEVLRLLQEMDEEQHQSAASIELAEDDDHAMQAHRDAKVEEALKKVPDNLRTVQYEVSSGGGSILSTVQALLTACSVDSSMSDPLYPDPSYAVVCIPGARAYSRTS